jgi:hypothetical protein
MEVRSNHHSAKLCVARKLVVNGAPRRWWEAAIWKRAAAFNYQLSDLSYGLVFILLQIVFCNRNICLKIVGIQSFARPACARRMFQSDEY